MKSTGDKTRKFYGVCLDFDPSMDIRKVLEADPNIVRWAFVVHFGGKKCRDHCHVYVEVKKLQRVSKHLPIYRRSFYYVRGFRDELNSFHGDISDVLRYFEGANSSRIVANFNVEKYLV